MRLRGCRGTEPRPQGRTQGLVVWALLIAPVVAPGLAAAASSDSPWVNPDDLVVTDATSDVGLQPGGPTSPLGPATESLDLVETRFFGETGEGFRVSVRTRNLLGDAQFPVDTTGTTSLYVCFRLADRSYALVLQFNAGSVSRSLLTNYFLGLVRAGECNTANGAAKTDGRQFDRVTQKGLSYGIDLEASRIEVFVARETFRELGEGEPPGPGELVSRVWTIALDASGQDDSRRAYRYDAAPDAAPSTDSWGLVFPTSNRELRMEVHTGGTRAVPCRGPLPRTAVEVEAGRARGVPITLYNHASRERSVAVGANIEGGEAWGVRVLPQVVVPRGGPEQAGNITLNLVVSSPAATPHRSCAVLHVRAHDPAFPDLVAESTIHAVAVRSPTPEANRLFLHTAPGRLPWFNVDAHDPQDQGRPVVFEGLIRGGLLAEYSPSTLATTLALKSDTRSTHDLVLNTTASGKTATVDLRMRSLHIPSRALLGVFLTTQGPSSELLGSRFEVLRLEPEPKTFRFVIPIHGPPGGPDRPSRVVDGGNFLQVAIQYEPLSYDDNVEALRPAGRVEILPEGSTADWPIWAVASRNVNEPGQTGRFLTLRGLVGERLPANPGVMRVLPVVVQNEGTEADTAALTVRTRGDEAPGWQVLVEPTGPLALDPAASRTVSIGVVPPPGAPDGSYLSLSVEVQSRADPTARAQLSFRVYAAKDPVLAAEGLVPLDVPSKSGSLPGPPPWALALAALAALGLLGRHARRTP